MRTGLTISLIVLIVVIVSYEFACVTVVFAKFLIFSRTIDIPLSSDAFNSSTRDFMSSGPYNSCASAKIVDVFPVPGGP